MDRFFLVIEIFRAFLLRLTRSATHRTFLWVWKAGNKGERDGLVLTNVMPWSWQISGTIGHVAHGKSTVVKAISGVQVCLSLFFSIVLFWCRFCCYWKKIRTFRCLSTCGVVLCLISRFLVKLCVYCLYFAWNTAATCSFQECSLWLFLAS
jgi:hypothetical protein